MVKKLMLLVVMTLLAIVPISLAVEVHAADILIDEPSVNTGGLWHEYVQDGESERVYVYMRYTYDGMVVETGSYENSEFPTYDYSKATRWHEFGYDLSIVEFPNTTDVSSASISNPNSSKYDQFTVEIISNVSHQSGELETASPQRITIYDSKEYGDSSTDNVTIEIYGSGDEGSSYLNPYFDLLLDGTEVLSSNWESDNPYKDEKEYGVIMYWSDSSIGATIDPNDSTVDDPWEALPDTSGSPMYPLGEWGTVTEITVANQMVSMSIEYMEVTYPVSEFLMSGDLDFINKANDILYYADPDTGDRILYFNFGDTLDDAVLAAKNFENINVWQGEALWNLTKNDVHVTEVLTVYNYIPEVDSDGNVYSYFYMPDVPIDNIISVTGILAYKYYTENIFGVTAGETQYKVVTATQGETDSVNPTWVGTAYKGAYIAGGFMTGAMIGATIAGATVPVIGWVVAGGILVTAVLLNVGDVNEWFAYDIDQIQHVIPDATLQNEINTKIAEESGADSFNPDTDKLYKLHLANLSEGDSVEILDEEFNITQVVWESDGEIFVVNEDNISTVTWGPGTETPTDVGLNDFGLLIVALGGIILLSLFVKYRVFEKPGLLIIIAGVVVYVLYYLDVITIP